MPGVPDECRSPGAGIPECPVSEPSHWMGGRLLRAAEGNPAPGLRRTTHLDNHRTASHRVYVRHWTLLEKKHGFVTETAGKQGVTGTWKTVSVNNKDRKRGSVLTTSSSMGTGADTSFSVSTAEACSKRSASWTARADSRYGCLGSTF
jgi:hypothetical protein